MARTRTIAVIGLLGIILLGIGLFLYFTDAPPQDLSTCAVIQDMRDKAACYMFVASVKKNNSMCDIFQSKIDRDICSSMISESKDGMPLHVEIMITIGVILIIAAILATLFKSRRTDEDIADVIKDIGWGIIIFSFIIFLLAGFGYLLYYLYVGDTIEKDITEAFDFKHYTYVDSSGYTWYVWTYKYYYISIKKINAIALFGVLFLIFGAALLLLSSLWLSGIYQGETKRHSSEVEELRRKTEKTGKNITNLNENILNGITSIKKQQDKKEEIDKGSM